MNFHEKCQKIFYKLIFFRDSPTMSRGQEFLGCSQDVLHRNQIEENYFCSQDNWQEAVICLAQVLK